MPSSNPPSRRTDLLVQQMDGELVLYDPRTSPANALNCTAAVIWQFADGHTEVNDLAARASQQLGAPVDTALVWYTLKQLSDKNLLRSGITPPSVIRSMTRRDFLRAGVVGAAVVLPVIVTMTAPAVSHAASCIENGQPCSENGPACCSDFCAEGTCR